MTPATPHAAAAWMSTGWGRTEGLRNLNMADPLDIFLIEFETLVRLFELQAWILMSKDSSLGDINIKY